MFNGSNSDNPRLENQITEVAMHVFFFVCVLVWASLAFISIMLLRYEYDTGKEIVKNVVLMRNRLTFSIVLFVADLILAGSMFFISTVIDIYPGRLGTVILPVAFFGALAFHALIGPFCMFRMFRDISRLKKSL